jgi:hypothetical protein
MITTIDKMREAYMEVINSFKQLGNIEVCDITTDFINGVSNISYDSTKNLVVNNELYTSITDIDFAIHPIWLDYENDEISGYCIEIHLFNDENECELLNELMVDEIKVKELKLNEKDTILFNCLEDSIAIERNNILEAKENIKKLTKEMDILLSD